jgi:hypothetical protein
MTKPKSTTLLWLAGTFLLFAAITGPSWYPAPIPVLGGDGSPVLGADGKPLLHRDLLSFHRMMLPCYVSSVCFCISCLWLLARVFRRLYEHSTQSPEKS